jgi:hypothetical protein
MGLLELIGLLIAAAIGGGIWQRGRQAKADAREKKEMETKLDKAKGDAKNDFTDDADAAREWLSRNK